VQVGIFVEGGRKGVIWIPEGRNGRGWRRFASELQLLISSKVKGLDLEAPLAPSSAGLFTGRSFVEVIREVPGPEGRISQKSMPLCLLDVLPVSGDCLGKGCGGSETRTAVDCYELELPVVTVCLPKRKRKGGSVATTTAGLRGKKMKGFLVNWWSKKYLGFSLVELGWILDGLEVKPNGLGASGAFVTSDPALDLGPGLTLDQGLVRSGSLGPSMDLDLGLGLDLGLCSDPVSDPGLLLDLDRDVNAVLVSSPTSVGSLSSTIANSLVSPDSAVILSVSSPSSVALSPSTVVTKSLTAMVFSASSPSLVAAVRGRNSSPEFLGVVPAFPAIPPADSALPMMPSLGSGILKEMGFAIGIHPSEPLTSALPSSADSSEIEVVPVPLPSPKITSNAIVDYGLKKSQNG
jgi:hypothetical protein